MSLIMLLPAEIESKSLIPALRAILAKDLAKKHNIREDEISAYKIQMRLFPPKETTIGEYHFARFIKSSAYLSGDFIDYFKIGNDHIVFYSADVSGHGVSSALVTILLKSFIRK